VAQQIEREGYTMAVLHSNKSQNQRQIALDRFRQGKAQILVATDIAARGLDIATISHVINYDIPDTADAYIHRIGRTGRAEREGDALTLVTSEDTATIRDIERALRAPIERRTVPNFDYSAPAPVLNEFQRGPRPQQGRGDRAQRSVQPSSNRMPGANTREEGQGPRGQRPASSTGSRTAGARPTNSRGPRTGRSDNRRALTSR
jgi:ATP-dependent RNA helicase RhlE